jgi:hypothetical protein
MLKSARKTFVFSFVLAALPVLAQESVTSPARLRFRRLLQGHTEQQAFWSETYPAMRCCVRRSVLRDTHICCSFYVLLG